MRAIRDVAYVEGGHERQRLDLYLPAADDGSDSNAASPPRPLLVWIHGGGWRQGSKDRCPLVLNRLIADEIFSRGYAVASIGYRLTDAARFPAQVDDCRDAVRFLQDRAGEYGLDPDRVGLWGPSAGGHLVAMTGLADGDDDLGIAAVCDFYGPTDLVRFAEDSPRVAADGSPEHRLLGGPVKERVALARRASPVTHVDADDPPFLIVHGTNDPLVPLTQSERLHEALRAAGVDSHLVVVDGGGHGGPGFLDPPMRDRILAFFDSHLDVGEPALLDLPERLTVPAPRRSR